MALGRLSMKVGKAGKAGPHAAYIAREGKYAERLDKGERLEAKEAGNMPAWAEAKPQLFWQAADAFERSNGTTYREMEIALPRELNSEQRIELVKGWVAQEIGDLHAYQWGIHVPLALDGGEQPHVHLMFSERQRDGIDRDPDQYFKRFNAKEPEKGGARKGYGENAGKTLTSKERADDLKALRGRWESACNNALERAGQVERIDMRSHAERGLDQVPEGKLLPSEWRQPEQRAQVIEFRAAKVEQKEANRDVARLVLDVRGELVNLAAERERRQAFRSLTPDQIKAAWKAEKAAQFKGIRVRAEDALNRADGMLTQREKTRNEHARARPDEPRGMLAGFKVATYEKAIAAWKSVSLHLERRIDRLVGHIGRLKDFATDQSVIFGKETAGGALAAQKAKQARPDLYEAFELVKAQQQEQQTRPRQEARTMKNEGNSLELDAGQKLDVDETAHGIATSVAKQLSNTGLSKEEIREQKLKEMREKREQERSEERDKGRSR